MLELRVVSSIGLDHTTPHANFHHYRCYNWSDVDLAIGRDLRKNQGRSVPFL